MALTDGAGLPLAVCLADGSKNDCTLVDKTLDEALIAELPDKLIGDKGFDSGKLATGLAARGIQLIAPKKSGPRPGRRNQDGRSLRRYCRRWKVERLFAWLKRYRRINTRWERKSKNYLGFVHLGCLVILVRHL